MLQLLKIQKPFRQNTLRNSLTHSQFKLEQKKSLEDIRPCHICGNKENEHQRQ